jgi:hypothetical protein
MANYNYFRGRNEQGAFLSFMNRTLYRSFAYSSDDAPASPRSAFPMDDPAKTYPIRNFQVYENFYYGRVDPFLRPVQPIKQLLVPLETGVYVLDFVKDAFLAMKQELDLTKTQRSLPADNPHILAMKALKGFEDINVAYNVYLQGIQKGFYWHIRDNSKLQLGREITSFETFNPIFTNFLKVQARQKSLSRGAFLLTSFYGSINNSGLAIEIADLDKSDDGKKYEFINSKCFPYYVKLASKYGFYIDYNVPWRLVADITSPPMLKFRELNNKGGGLSSFFKTCYTRIDYEETKVIKNLYFKTYRDFVNARPWFTKSGWVQKKTASKPCKYSQRIYRIPITYDIFSSEYDTAYWLKKYIKIKNWESGNTFPPPQLRRIINNSQDLEKRVDNMTALSYISSKFRRIVATANGSFNQRLYASKYKDLENLPFSSLQKYLDEIYSFKAGNF